MILISWGGGVVGGVSPIAEQKIERLLLNEMIIYAAVCKTEYHFPKGLE